MANEAVVSKSRFPLSFVMKLDAFLKPWLAVVVAVSLTLVSCNSTKDVVYFQDLPLEQEQAIVNLNQVKIQPGDQISIVVSCKDPEVAMIFNLVQVNNRLGQNTGTKGSVSTDSSNGVSYYLVNSFGDIDFPILGEIHVAGLTREEVQRKIKKLIVDGGYINEPIVTVNFVNLHFSMIGQVSSPGKYAITDDKINLVEAFAMAGDLDITGLRNRVFVIREQDGKRTAYRVDMRSPDVFKSPVYYLQQNDIVYVEPNNMKAGQASVNQNVFKSATFWMSLASFATSMILLIKNW